MSNPNQPGGGWPPGAPPGGAPGYPQQQPQQGYPQQPQQPQQGYPQQQPQPGHPQQQPQQGYPQQQPQQGYPQQAAAPMAAPAAPGYPAAPQAAAGGGQLELTTGFFILAWILFLITPTVEINRQPQPRKWGTHLIDLPPGQYELTVSFRYLFIEKCGAATVHVPIYPGQATIVKYEAPFFMFSAGTMNILGNRPMMAQPMLPG